VKKIFTLVLGVVTSIGGFVEAGSTSTAALDRQKHPRLSCRLDEVRRVTQPWAPIG
jgi:hypothetical protein